MRAGVAVPGPSLSMLSPGVNESQLDSIVEQIYAAAAGSGPWSAPLDAIARAYSLWAV